MFHVRRRFTVIAIGVLIVLSIVFFYNRDSQEASRPESKPQYAQRVSTTPESQQETTTHPAFEPARFRTPHNQTRANACFVILTRNSELYEWKYSMQQLERQFNHRFNYPYVFLNDVEFTQEFKDKVTSLTAAKVEFATVPKAHWSVPDHLDKNVVTKALERMERDGVKYGGMESYHHMCRFESGFFFQQEIIQKYEYYWRVEPGVQFSCPIEEDPFLYMQQNDLMYGFTISLHEIESTIPTLWNTTKEWINGRGLWDKFPKDNALSWISDDKGETYNGCHFWSNFEIASLDLWRDPQYIDYFNYLDQAGGFFLERWGDAPVHSIYAALTLPKDKIHFFNEIGYFHSPYWHCPVQPELQKKCTCDPNRNFDLDSYSCNKQWFDLNRINYKKRS